MAFKADKIWMDGKFVNWDDAKIHVLSHAVHYGTAAFEGIRCYHNSKGSAVFRLQEHIKRLYETCKIYSLDVPYSQKEMCDAIMELLRVNKLKEAYIRPLVYRGFGQLGINPLACPINVMLAAWDWGKYLGEEAMEKGISVAVSSWRRSAPDTLPTLAKMAGNYLNSQLIKLEALRQGCDEGIALDYAGFVSEGSGENIFIVRNGTLYTPPSSSAILAGITRHSVFKIARDLNIRCEQHQIMREALYIADEVFMTGTAAEITPVTKIDGIAIGAGTRGPVTKQIQDDFFAILENRKPDKYNWLSYI